MGVFGNLVCAQKGYFCEQAANAFSSTSEHSWAVPGARHGVAETEHLGSGTRHKPAFLGKKDL